MSKPQPRNGRDAYPVVFLQRGESPQQTPHLQIHCCHRDCTRTEEIPLSTSVPLPANVANRKFIQKGWFPGATRNKDFCPIHGGRTHKPAPAKANPLDQLFTPAPEPETPTVTADPTPVPTREDKRRILDKLNEVYAHDRYVGGHSDTSVAKDLDVPRLWVADIRDEFFGPDRNEAQELLRQEVERVKAVAAALEERAMQLAAEAEALRQQATELLQKAA